jgi:hypothetical protein
MNKHAESAPPLRSIRLAVVTPALLSLAASAVVVFSYNQEDWPWLVLLIVENRLWRSFAQLKLGAHF